MLKASEYNRKEYIENYILTDDEFNLLNNQEQLVYASLRYGWILESLQDLHSKKTVYGYIPDRYNSFFVSSGCKVEHYDFGTEETEITKVKTSEVTISPEQQQEISKYVSLVASTKADIVEKRLLTYLANKAKQLRETGTFVTDQDTENNIVNTFTSFTDSFTSLTKEEQDKLVAAELSLVMQHLNNLETVSLRATTKEQYTAYIQSQGFAITIDSTSQKLVKKINEE